MKITAHIEVSLPDDCAADLAGFAPVEGRWATDTDQGHDRDWQELVEPVAARLAGEIVGDAIECPEWNVQLFRADGRSLDGSSGICGGSLLITRR